MVYATYEYYVSKYFGNAVSAECFTRVIRKASQYIDHFTFGRLVDVDITEYPILQDCACAMADAIHDFERPENKKEKKSENIDGYSVTYVTESSDGRDKEAVLKEKLYSLAKLYLMNTGLLSLEC